MGLKDLFKPKYNHSNRTIRLNALEGISDEDKLLQVVFDAEYPDTWKKAIEKSNSVEILGRIILPSKDGRIIRKKIVDLHLRRREAIKKVTDPSLLKEIVEDGSADVEVFREAVRRFLKQMKDEEAILTFIMHANRYDAIEEAIRYLSSVKILVRLSNDYTDERYGAYTRRDAQRRLEELKTIALQDLTLGKFVAAKEYVLEIGNWFEKSELIEQLPNEEITKEILQTLSNRIYAGHSERKHLEEDLERILSKMQAAGWRQVGKKTNYHLCKECSGKGKIWVNLGSWNESDVDGPYECGTCGGGGQVRTESRNYSKDDDNVSIVFTEGKLSIS